MRRVAARTRAAIAELRSRGATTREIGRALGVSASTVSLALRREGAAPRSRAAAPPADVPAAGGEAPTLAELGADLADLLRELRVDAARARAEGDDVALARAHRLLGTLAPVVARLAREREAQPEGVFVARPDIEAAAQRARDKLLELAARKLSAASEGKAP